MVRTHPRVGRRTGALILVAAAALPVLPVLGVIRVEFPVTKICTESRDIWIGTVERVTPESRLVEIAVEETAKGTAGAVERVRLQVVAPAEVFERTAPKQRAIIFVGGGGNRPMAIAHLADTWVIGEALPGAAVPTWRIQRTYEGAQAFPGRTAVLERVVREIQAGRSPLLDTVDLQAFRGGAVQLGTTVKDARFLLAFDVNGDGLSDFLAGNESGVQLLVNAGGKVAEATAAWGLAGTAGSWAAAGDVDGDSRPDLVLAGRLHLNLGRSFGLPVAEFKSPDGPLAVALADATGDGRADFLALGRDGSLAVFVNPGPEGGPWRPRPDRRLWPDDRPVPFAAAFSTHWGDAGRQTVLTVSAAGVMRFAIEEGVPPAGDRELAGVAVGPYGKDQGAGPEGVPKAGREAVTALPIDLNGDGRLDFLIVTAESGDVLVNRGFGVFLAAMDGAEALHIRPGHTVPWGRVTAAMRLVAADLHGDRFDDLVILAPDGRLFALRNPPF